VATCRRVEVRVCNLVESQPEIRGITASAQLTSFQRTDTLRRHWKQTRRYCSVSMSTRGSRVRCCTWWASPACCMNRPVQQKQWVPEHSLCNERTGYFALRRSITFFKHTEKILGCRGELLQHCFSAVVCRLTSVSMLCHA
jgi:hypothetical protein